MTENGCAVCAIFALHGLLFFLLIATHPGGSEATLPQLSPSWESIASPFSGTETSRCRVPGGWVMASRGDVDGLVFIPDQDGIWDDSVLVEASEDAETR